MMYRYYQKIGGDEAWQPIQVNRDLSEVKPTFVTVLSLDTLLDSAPTREDIDRVKYEGPLYFDLDASDLEDSIDGAKELYGKLAKFGLTGSDIEVFLSGKKGFHFLVPPECFMEGKVLPLAKLPTVYKEMAFKLAVDTLDFAVYTARKGRMLRTCYNIRENGNYRVPITVEELLEMTEEKYQTLCKTPRVISAPKPVFCPDFALLYDECKQKIQNQKPKKSKPVDEATLRKHLPLIQQVMAGDNLEGGSFNKVGIQLALYAREARMTADELIKACYGLLQSHESDGVRYNTPAKREHELRRMFFYVEDNSAYEYAIEPIKALFKRAKAVYTTDEGEVIESEVFSCGVQVIGNSYVVSKGDAGDMAITNFVFDDVIKLVQMSDQTITGLVANLKGDARGIIKVLPLAFAGSSGINAAVMPYGGSFTGTDNHARGLFQIMLKAVSETRYLIDSEGVNLISMPRHSVEALRKPFVVWADAFGVRTPEWVDDLGIKFEFQGYPTPEGVLETDLSLSPSLGDYLAVEGNKEELTEMLTSLLTCQSPDVISKMVGWMVACFWRQLLHATHDKFPLLHIYGVAGAGKSEMTESMMHFFYYNRRPVSVTPSGTPFAFQTLVGGSSSIPVLLDEYKPGTMNKEVLEKYRAIFRDAYNMKDTQRGGGSRSKESYNALNKVSLSGPIIFLAEAVETETAIMERTVLVTVKRPSPLVSARSYNLFKKFSSRSQLLAILGQAIAGRVTKHANLDLVKEEFDKVHDWALDAHMLRAGDAEKVEKGEMSETEFNRRAGNKQRSIYNNSVVMFGLLKFKQLLKQIYREEFPELFEETFHKLETSVFSGMEVMARSTVPEYVKILTAMSDMTRLPKESAFQMQDGFEYTISDIGGKAVLVVAPRAAYNKYRSYCKYMGTTAMYPTESAFTQALQDIPQFLGNGAGTKKMRVETIVMDAESLYRAGVAAWEGKSQTLAVF